MYFNIPVEFLGNMYYIHWYILAIFIYVLIYFCFIKLCKALKAAAVKAGRASFFASIVSYSPLVVFPILPLIPILGFKAIFGSSEYMWLVSIMCIIFTYAPYFIFMFWYCNISKEDIDEIYHQT
jgi:hypothetical protein